MKDDAVQRIQFDGLEEAVIGLGHQYTKPPLLIYSAAKIIDILMERDGMDYEEAVEFFEFNIACLWAGEGTPIIVMDLEDPEEDGNYLAAMQGMPEWVEVEMITDGTLKAKNNA